MNIDLEKMSSDELVAFISFLETGSLEDKQEWVFRLLEKERRTHTGSQEQWPEILRGELDFDEEWEIKTREKLGLEVPEYVRIQAKIKRDVMKQGLKRY